ncbi:MAG: DJ-1/PfpI family protein [Solobacterium sp.]|nr:DJ-1/PfpI family protein [Solobacterium sp.]
MNRCAIFLADGFETCEGMITVDMLRRAQIPVDLISMNDDLNVTTSHGIHLTAEKVFSETDLKDYDVLILPGGKLGTANLESCEPLKAALKEHLESGKLTCAICAAPSILGHMGLLAGRKYTCFPTFDSEYGGEYQMELAVTDGNLITGRGMGATIEFARHILMKLTDEEVLEKVQNGIQYEHTFRSRKE